MSGRSILMQGIVFALLASVAVAAPPAKKLIVRGDFEGLKSGKQLRADNKGQDWYESRKDTKKGRALLILSKKKVGGNATQKAMIKADPDLNTYLSQRLGSPQKGTFTVQYDVYVRDILADDNRSAFFMIGDNKDGKNGPNSTGMERFVFMGFENAAEPGKVNLFAREGKTKWENKTLVARDLDVKKWYTVVVTVHVADEVYEVSVPGVTAAPVPLGAFQAGKKVPGRLTHVSFASWNDGAGTFYIDNVSAR